MPDEKAISLDKQLNEIRESWYEAFPPPAPAEIGMDGSAPAASMISYVCEVFDDAVIVCFGETYYRVPYTLDGEDEVAFAPRQDWQEVESQQSWVDVVKAAQLEAAKAGARNSQSDLERLQQVHDLVVQNGAVCPGAKQAALEDDTRSQTPMKGNALKALSQTDDELRVANYIIVFGKRDLEGYGSPRVNRDGTKGEQFSPDVDVDSDYTKTGLLYVDWEHGQDPDSAGMNEDTVLGYVDWKTAKRDERGIFVERVLNRRNKYMQWLEGLIQEGLVSNSSEALPGVTKTADGVITRWPLKRDALTVNPMQWQNMSENQVQALKALGVEVTELVSGSTAEAAPQAAPDAAAGEPEPVVIESQREVKAMTEFTEDQIKAIAGAAAKEAVEQYRKSEPADKSAGVVVTHDEGDNKFTSIAEQCKAVKAWETSKGHVEDVRLPRLAAKALGASEGVAADGGFLLEPTLTSDILKPLHDEGPFTSQGIAKLPVGSNSNYGYINGVDETSRATGSRWGGIQGYRLAEGATLTGSRPKFRRINWELRKYAVLCYATDELLADASQFSAVVRMGAGEELTFMVNDDILNGLGGAGCLGILNSGAVISVAKEGGQGAATINQQNIIKMWSRLHARSKAKARWYYNTDCGPQLHTLALAVGTGGLEPRFVTYAADGSLTIFGKPAIETEFNPTLGTVGDIVVGDLSQYLMWEKQGVQEASSIHVQFLTDEQVFRFIYRADGQPATAAPLTPYKGTNTVSPFVALATRA